MSESDELDALRAALSAKDQQLHQIKQEREAQFTYNTELLQRVMDESAAKDQQLQQEVEKRELADEAWRLAETALAEARQRFAALRHSAQKATTAWANEAGGFQTFNEAMDELEITLAASRAPQPNSEKQEI